jgi:hypothetical protein
MTGFFEELGKKLADRWLELLVLPGLLWIATLGAAVRLGWRHPFALSHLSAWLDRLGSSAATHGTGYAVVAAVGVLLASSAVGLGATLVGALAQRLWGATGDRAPMSWLLGWRRRGWTRIPDRAGRAYLRSTDTGFWSRVLRAPAKGYARRLERLRIARPTHAPERPTRIAERFRATALRMRNLYRLDLDLAWPRLWTLLPSPLREDISRAADAYAASARLAAWGLLYLLLVTIWWPALFIAAAIWVAAATRARSSANLLAELVETAVDLHLTKLAGRLEIPDGTPLTKLTGAAVSRRLSEGPPDPAAAHTGPPHQISSTS